VIGLRRLRPLDLWRLRSLWWDPAFRRTGVGVSPPLFYAGLALGAVWPALWKKLSGADFLVMQTRGGAPAGMIVLKRHAPTWLEMGTAVHPAFRRRGCATAARRLALRRAFDEGVRLVRVWLRPENLPNARGLRKLGFYFVPDRPDGRLGMIEMNLTPEAFREPAGTEGGIGAGDRCAARPLGPPRTPASSRRCSARSDPRTSARTPRSP